MEVRCESCSSLLRIPEEKASAGRRLVVRCPKCRDVLRVDLATPGGQGQARPLADRPRGAAGAMPGEDYAYAEDTLEYFEEGIRLALVMEDDAQQMELVRRAVEDLGYTYVQAESTREAMDKMRFHHMMDRNAQQVEKLRQTVVELGYAYITAENSREAIGKLRFHHFDLMILSDRFDGLGLSQSPILRYLNNLPMSIRRRMFLVLLGDDFKTLDHLQAFALSANLVVNRAELDKLKDLLQHSAVSHQRFYKVLLDTLAETGKA